MSNRSTPTRRSSNLMSSSSRQASEADNRIAEAMDTSESDLARPLPPSSPQVPGSGENKIISTSTFTTYFVLESLYSSPSARDEEYRDFIYINFL